MPIPPSEHPANQPGPREDRSAYSHPYIEDKAPNEHFTESGVGDVEARSHECPKCFEDGDRVEGEVVEHHRQERTHDQEEQEVTVRECPECGFVFSDV